MHAEPQVEHGFWNQRDWWALGALSALSLLFFWPTLRDLGGTFVGVFLEKGDAEGTWWWSWWVRTALADPALKLWFTDYLYYPVGVDVAPLYGASLLNMIFYLPWMWLLPAPLHNNLWCLVIQLADGAVAYYVLRRLVRGRHLAWAGAVVWTLAPYKFLEFRDGHLPQILLTFIPLAFLGLWRLRKKPTVALALLTGLALALDGCGYYQHLYGDFFLALFFLVSGWWHLRGDRGLLWRYGRAQLLIAGVMLLGVAVIYPPLIRSVSAGRDAPWSWRAEFPPNEQINVPDSPYAILWNESVHLFAQTDWTEFPNRIGLQTYYSQKNGWHVLPEQAFLLLTALAGLALGLAARRRAVLPMLLGLLFTLIVIGPVITFSMTVDAGRWVTHIWRNPVYIALHDFFPSFNRLYWPNTFWPFAIWAWAATLAIALDELRPSRLLRRWRGATVIGCLIVAGTLFATLAFLEDRPFIGRFFTGETPKLLAAEPGRAFFSLPTGQVDDHNLPLVILSGKAMVGGRGRSLDYLEPQAFAALTTDDPWLRAFHRWSELQDDPAPPASGLSFWTQRDVRHVAVNRRVCRRLDRQLALLPEPDIQTDEQMEVFLRRKLAPVFGEPAFADDDWLIYRLP